MEIEQPSEWNEILHIPFHKGIPSLQSFEQVQAPAYLQCLDSSELWVVLAQGEPSLVPRLLPLRTPHAQGRAWG